MAALSMSAGALGNARTETLRAFSETEIKCKNWYPTSRTLSDDQAHRGAKDHRSVRTFAVEPARILRREAFVPLSGLDR